MPTEAEILRQRVAELEAEKAKLEAENAKLREDYHLYSQIIEHMPAGFVLYEPIYDDNGNAVDLRYLQTNALNERMLGVSRSAFLGKRYDEAFPEGDISWLRIVDEAARKGESVAFEYRSQVHHRRFQVIGYGPRAGHGAILFIDIEDRVQAEREIRSLNAELERRVEARTAEFEEVNQALQAQIVESIQAQELSQRYADEITDLYNNAPCGYHSLDVNGVFIRMNDTELKMLGYTREEVIGKLRMIDLIPPEDREKFRQGFHELRTKGAVHDIEGEFVLKDGTRMPILLNSTAAFDEHGQFTQTRSTVVDLTEIRRTEALAQQYANELEELYNNAPFGYHTIDARGIFTRINDTELKWLGYTREEVIGKASMYDLMTPESRWLAQEVTPLFLERGSIENLELTVVCKDGRKIPMLFSGRTVKGADGGLESIRVTLVDITERKKTDALLLETASELADLYNNAPCGYYSLDSHGTFIRVNDTQLKMIGYRREEVEGRMKVFDLYPPEQMDAAVKRFERLRTTGAVRDVETRVRHKDGRELPVLINSSVVYDDQGAFVRTRSTMLDMSELRKAQDLIMELNHHLEVRAQMLENANKELEAFSYSVSHDLRAPLRAIDGFSRMVMEAYGDAMPEKGQHYLRRVRENSARMGQLIDDLLDFSRTSRRPITKVPVSPPQIALQIVAELREQQPDLRAQIVVHDMPAARADVTLLRQVYANLIGNAIKFTREKPDPMIEIGCDQSKDQRIYYIRDNGVGFDMTYVDKIFGVFQRLHNQSEYEGTGVGLATVQRIIHRHGGKIWAEAVIDKGATFFFTLGED